MLSDREENSLREVQRQLLAEDPDFVRSFDDAGQQYSIYSVHSAYVMPRAVYSTAIIVAVTLGILMLAVKASGFALLFAVLAILIAVIRRHRDAPGSSATRREEGML